MIKTGELSREFFIFYDVLCYCKQLHIGCKRGDYEVTEFCGGFLAHLPLWPGG